MAESGLLITRSAKDKLINERNKKIVSATYFMKTIAIRLNKILICLILTLLVTIYWAPISSIILPYDISLLELINQNRVKSLDPIFIFITNSSPYISVGIIIVVFILSKIYKSALLRKKGWQLAASFTLAVFLTVSLKQSFSRFRPFINYKYIDQLVEATTPSFPSGHTLQAFAIATTLILLFKNKLLFAIALTWAVAVTISRLVLGVHFPSDVIAGTIIGILSSYFCHLLFIKIHAQ